MKLLIISDAPILFKNKEKVAYAPYVKEMNIWMKYACSTTYVCPTRYDRSLLTKAFDNQYFQIKGVKRLEFHRNRSVLISLLSIPYQAIILWNAMRKADHIHLRCPGNLALLASLIQVTLPRKPKTVKYAGNFDPCASQPLAYRWQKRILSNSFLTKNIAVLVYGDWPNQTKNIKSFFTATYKKEQIEPAVERNWNGPLKAIFVGTISANKRPLEVFEIIKELVEKGIDISLDFYGDGPLRKEIASKVKEAALEKRILLHGNVDHSIVTESYKTSHFSFLLSKSEGWPKAVAEAMFWGCIPVASKVSCVPWMLGIEIYNFQLPTFHADKPTNPSGLGRGMDVSSNENDASSSESDALSLSKGRERLKNEEIRIKLNSQIPTSNADTETYPLGLGKGLDTSLSESDALSLWKGRERLQNKETNPSGLGKVLEATQRGILINDVLQAGTLVEEYLQQPELLHEMSQKASKWSQHYTLDDFENEIALLLKGIAGPKARTK
jgi:glycosyltransferase involved in cell wall biosynthesis